MENGGQVGPSDRRSYCSLGQGQPPPDKPIPWGGFILMCLKALNGQVKVV